MTFVLNRTKGSFVLLLEHHTEIYQRTIKPRGIKLSEFAANCACSDQGNEQLCPILLFKIQS